MNKKILIVDHDRAARAQVRCALNAEDCEVYEAGDGVEVFRKLNAGLSPELIIASVEVARDQSVNLVKAIRQISAYRRTPILIMDMSGGGECRMDWKEEEGTACIFGPFENSEMLEKIKLLMQ